MELKRKKKDPNYDKFKDPKRFTTYKGPNGMDITIEHDPLYDGPLG